MNVFSLSPAGLRRSIALLSLVGLSTILFAQAPSPRTRSATDEPPPETEVGIPVTDKLTIEKCGSCHKADEKGDLTRISWIRTTPEGWEEAIKRMVKLNGLMLSPPEARHIVTYLAKDHGDAPEEVAPYRWFLEKRQPFSEPVPGPEIRMACASCHPLARPRTWHRSATEWGLLVNMHEGYFPSAERTSLRVALREDSNGIHLPPNTPKPAKEPVDLALDYLRTTNGLHSAAWSSWRANMRDLDLKGRWIVDAYQPGKGRYFGFMTISPRETPDNFRTETTLTRIADGSKVVMPGQSVTYSGYEWRGRSKMPGIGDIRQVMAVAADQSSMEGRWFWGGYDEFGLNVKARRDNSDIAVLGTNVYSLRAGVKGIALRVLGERFPANLTAADIGLGAGVHVSKILSVKPTEISLLVDVDPVVVSGFRSLSIKSTVVPQAFSVYDKIDYIKVANDGSVARLGGATHEKGYVQFEAIAFNRGIDGLPNTADDVSLGPVTAKWSMEEFISHYGDDDKEFIGSLDTNGLFTPAMEGPNPQRRFSTNNNGDVWVVATYRGKGSPEALTAKAYLVVAVPLYMKWDQPEVGQ